MEFSQWEKYYEQILLDFGYERAKDDEAAAVLEDVSTGRNLASVGELKEHLVGKIVHVFGDGPSLPKTVADNDFDGTLIAADGATSSLMAKGIVPHIIVTDLDGKVEDQIAANEKGAIVIILAHGDNITALKEWVPKFPGKIMATAQSGPRKHLLNFGGFTDGDRGAFLADHFGAKRIILVGFDFGSDRGWASQEEYEEEIDPSDRNKVKMRKLTWANVLIAMLDNPAIQFYR
jgi:uncharacterized Rossmann fold enzyme